MGLFDDPDFVMTALNLAILVYVVYDINDQLSAIFTYLAHHDRREELFITFVNRLSSRVYFIFLLISAGLIFVVKNSDSGDTAMLIAPVALVIGFFFHALIYKICFVNDAGLGSISVNDEMEIQWNEILTYSWKENVLHLTLKRKWITQKRIKFNDSSAIVAVNDRLRRLTHLDNSAVSNS